MQITRKGTTYSLPDRDKSFYSNMGKRNKELYGDDYYKLIRQGKRFKKTKEK